jgi:hypothetical protein
MIGKEREVLAKRKDGYVCAYRCLHLKCLLLNFVFSLFFSKILQTNTLSTTFPCVLGLSEIDTNDGTKLFVGFLEDITARKSLLIAEAEREASDNLLHNILPEHIAKRLKQDPSHIADHYENTTILFADIVGFTDKTSSMSPHAIVTMLNNLFSQFDYLVGHYDLNKVKTIGDCYMVTSIPSSEIDNDGCSRVCMFALDLMKCVKSYNISGPLHGHIDMRVGIGTMFFILFVRFCQNIFMLKVVKLTVSCSRYYITQLSITQLSNSVWTSCGRSRGYQTIPLRHVGRCSKRSGKNGATRLTGSYPSNERSC